MGIGFFWEKIGWDFFLCGLVRKCLYIHGKDTLGYPSRPMATSPRHPYQCASCHFLGKGDFWKNRPCGGQKSILTICVRIVQGPQKRSQSVPRGPIDLHLSWFRRRKLLDEYKNSTIFGDFGCFEEFPNMARPPPSYAVHAFLIWEIEPRHFRGP